MNIWTALLDVLILLLAAMILGALCERLKQSAILGYSLAGTSLGPNALNWMPNYEAVSSIAELGVAPLLFTIRLEFSWNRLKKLGPVALAGGSRGAEPDAALSSLRRLFLSTFSSLTVSDN